LTEFAKQELDKHRLNLNITLKQNILHLTSAFEVGGQQKIISDIVHYDSFNAHYLTILRRSTEALAFFKKEIQVLFYKGLSDDEIIDKLKYFISENSIDIILAHNRIAWDISTEVIKNISGVYVYFVAHSIDVKRYQESDSEREFKFKSNIGLTEKMICTSAYLEKEYSMLLFEEKQKIIKIYNGVEILRSQAASLRKKIRNSLGLNDDSILVGIVARLAKIKNQEFLIEAASSLIKTGEKKFKLVIIGDGPEYENLLLKISELDLDDYIILKENSFSINDYYEAFDIFVNCSLFESCSLAILEAMSHALPVIASDVGGNSELVIDNKTGFLFPLNSKEEFVGKLKMLLNNPVLRRKLGNNARNLVITKFNIQNTIRKYQKLFSSHKKQIDKKVQRIQKEFI